MSSGTFRAGAAAGLGALGRRTKETRPGREVTGRGSSEPGSFADRNADRVLALLGAGDMTIAALLAGGVRSPGQSLYDLQLAGYPVERVRVTLPSGQSSTQYRLGIYAEPLDD